MPAISPDTIKPTLQRVGSEILRRTQNSRGKILGTFTEDTTPDATVAQEKIDQAADSIALQLGNAVTTWTGNLAASATNVVAVEAALRIERASPNPDSVIVIELRDQVKTDLAALIATARDNQPGGQRHYSVPQRNWTGG